MKICHLTSVHSESDTRIFIKECCSLATVGYEVNLVVPGALTTTSKGVKIHGVSKIDGNRIKRMTQTVSKIYEKAIEIDADIYHFHDPELLPVGLKLKKKGKKVVYDVHEDVPRDIMLKEWIPLLARKFISFTFERYENYAARNMDKIITSTKHIEKRFSILGCNTLSIYNYPLIDELIQEGEKKILERPNTLRVCYIGGINKGRGLFEMLQAISVIDGLELTLVGNFVSEEEKLIAMKKDEWSKVEYKGKLDREGVANVLGNSFAGLVVLNPTSTYIHSMPIKMFEYMSAGIPVIASNFPLWKEIIEGSNCGICVNPLDPKEIAEAINYLIDNPQEAQKMGNNGRNAVVEKYNWETESEKIIRAYESLVR